MNRLRTCLLPPALVSSPAVPGKTTLLVARIQAAKQRGGKQEMKQGILVFSWSGSRLAARAALAAALGVLSVRFASAQDVFSPEVMQGNLNTWNFAAVSQEPVLHYLRHEGRNGGKKGRTGKNRKPIVTTAKSSTAYRPQPAVTTRVRARYVSYVARLSPGDRHKVTADMKRYDTTKIWAGLVAENGLRPGDVADAMTGYYVLNWFMANKATSEPSRSEVLAVHRQFQSVMTASPSFARLSSAKKQEIAEVFMLNFLYQQKMFATAVQQNDQALLQKLSDAAASRFESDVKLDPRKVKIGSTGLRLVTSR